MKERKEKVCSLEEAAARIPDGAMIGFGGSHAQNTPMAVVREIIRKGIKDLTVVPGVSAGLPVDLLIGAGCVSTVVISYIGMEHFGLAPNFRKAAEEKKINIREGCEALVVYGYKAAAADLPFFALPGGHELTDVVKVNTRDYKRTTNPFTGKEVVVIPPLAPDFGLLHVAKCDPYGNAQALGAISTMKLLAQAAKKVIVTTEKVVSLEETRRSKTVNIPGFLVDMVVEIPFGAHPGSCQGAYDFDEKHLQMYVNADIRQYLEEYIHGPQDYWKYLEMIGMEHLMSLTY